MLNFLIHEPQIGYTGQINSLMDKMSRLMSPGDFIYLNFGVIIASVSIVMSTRVCGIARRLWGTMFTFLSNLDNVYITFKPGR